MLTTNNDIVYFLLERGLLTHDSVVGGDLMVADASRRNRNFKVIRKHQPGYFVKQIKTWDPQAIASLQREAACYWLSKNDPEFARLIPFVPDYYDFDPVRYFLVIELLPEGENLTEYHQRLKTFPHGVAAQLGCVLGSYHRNIKATRHNNPQDYTFPKQPPWILSLHQHNAAIFQSLSAANSQIVSIIRQFPKFLQNLDALRSNWQTNSLIHGDMKWDNCIVYEPDKGQNEPTIKVVDWELADFGDAGWDVGAIFQGYLVFWIMSMQIPEDVPPVRFLKQAQYPLEDMQPALRAFWESYTETRELGGNAAGEFLERSVQYGAARMIQTTYEYMCYSSQVSANAIYLLQLSLNVLSNPRDAIQYLLGIEKA